MTRVPLYNGVVPDRSQSQEAFNTNVKSSLLYQTSLADGINTAAAEIIAMADIEVYAAGTTYNIPDAVVCTNGLTYRCKGASVVGQDPITDTAETYWVRIMLQQSDFTDGKPTVIALEGVADVFTTPAIFTPKIGVVFGIILPDSNTTTTPTLDGLPLHWGEGTSAGYDPVVGDFAKNTELTVVAVDTDTDGTADEYHVLAGVLRWVAERSTDQTGFSTGVLTDIVWETNDNRPEWDVGMVEWTAPRTMTVDIAARGLGHAGGLSPDGFSELHIYHNSASINTIMNYALIPGLQLWERGFSLTAGDTLKVVAELTTIRAGELIFGPDGSEVCEFVIIERT